MKDRVSKASYKEILFVFFILVILTQNLFFELYRYAIFNVMPHDDYGRYLLYFVGDDYGLVPVASHAYRGLAVLLAVPFYHTLPLFTFTGLPEGLDENYIRSILSLSFVTYLSIVVICIYSYLIARNRFGASKIVGFVTLLLTYLVTQHLREGLFGVDAMGVMMLTLVVYYLDNKLLYIVLLLSSIFINEKVAMVFFILFAGRFVFDKERKFDVYLVGAAFSLALYALANLYFHLPGNEEHRDVVNFFSQFAETLQLSLTFKGMLLNVVPMVIVVYLYYLACSATKYTQTGIYFKKIDFLPIVGLIVITHLVDVDYNAGRIIMFLFPLYVPLAAIAVSHVLTEDKINQEYLNKSV